MEGKPEVEKKARKWFKTHLKRLNKAKSKLVESIYKNNPLSRKIEWKEKLWVDKNSLERNVEQD